MYRFVTALALLLGALLLQVKLGQLLGWYPNGVIAVLVALSFFMNFSELAALVLVAAGILNWQPWFGMEIIVLTLYPLSVFLFRRIIFPLEGWLVALITAAAGVILIDAASGSQLILEGGAAASFSQFREIGSDVLLGLVFAAATFHIMKYAHEEYVA